MRSARRLTATLFLVASAGCQDRVPAGPQDGGLSQLIVTYVCGNNYDLHNPTSLTMTVQYAVLGTSEDGELIVPSRPSDGSESTTRLTTVHRGALRVTSGDDALAPVNNAAITCPPPASATQPQATLGEWSGPFPWPVVAVHLHLLPNGQVLSWGRLGPPQVWDPITSQFIESPSSTMVFCSGHTFLPDGRLLVAGGHLDDQRGLPDANIFDPASRVWTPIAPMRRGRWYPTSTTLSNGETLVLAGTNESGEEVTLPEVWTGTTWRALPGASRTLPYYPRAFLAPNGLVFYAGELRETGYLDPAGAGGWTPVANSNYGRRDYGSAVMYQPGKVMILGGSDPPNGTPTSSAELIDLNQHAPSWRYTGRMAHARRQFNATLLPDGQVLATGGTSSAGFSELARAVRAAEAWDPETGRWSLLASSGVSRVYHSTTLLLPDGRVLHSGSGDGPGLPRELSAELFSPPYLFRGARPRITDAPAHVGYGQQFSLGSPDAGQVVRVTLLRLGSVTHAFDQSQRFLELEFRKTAGGVTLTGPGSNTLAPPGPYLIFILDGNGVPSIGSIVRVG